jgi:hypothetical protein
MAATHRGTIGFKESVETLQKEGLEIDHKEYYNLHCKGTARTLTRQEELMLLLQTLEQERVHPRVNDTYIIEDGIRKRRVIKDLFWRSLEQIKMGRRFVSSFIFETDATFCTNE